MAVPYTFASATGSLPLSQLDANFNTPITVGNTSVQLGNVVTTLSGLTLVSPTLTGIPTAPTATAGDNSTQVATTQFVTTGLANYATLASPVFTGTPTAPTATAGTSDTQIATTAFVAGTAFSAALPAQTGNSGKYVTTNGSTASWAIVSPIPTVQVFTSSTTWVCPTNITKAKITVVGGGGSGASVVSQGSPGGAGGGTAIKTLTVTPGVTYTVTIGAGGSGLSAGGGSRAGNAGGTSSFSGSGITTVSATGGAGGSTTAGAASVGGIGSNGDLNIQGSSGTGSTVNVFSPVSLGGGTIFSGSIPSGTTAFYGCGTAGIANDGGSANAASGVIVLEY